MHLGSHVEFFLLFFLHHRCYRNQKNVFFLHICGLKKKDGMEKQKKSNLLLSGEKWVRFELPFLSFHFYFFSLFHYHQCFLKDFIHIYLIFSLLIIHICLHLSRLLSVYKLEAFPRALVLWGFQFMMLQFMLFSALGRDVCFCGWPAFCNFVKMSARVAQEIKSKRKQGLKLYWNVCVREKKLVSP